MSIKSTIFNLNRIFMKRKYIGSLFIAAALFTACNNDDSTAGGTASDSANSMSTNTGTTDNTTMSDTSSRMNNNMAMSSTPLEGMDKEFVMKAAKGGMMEVEAANIAMQNSSNERVKAYASMMIADHGKANNELKSMVSAKGMMVPEDSLMMKNKAHLDGMKAMKGKAFDKHYIDMMVKDHNKDVNDFEKASNSANDADVKAFATKTLPTLRMHKDSIQAIAKMKM